MIELIFTALSAGKCLFFFFGVIIISLLPKKTMPIKVKECVIMGLTSVLEIRTIVGCCVWCWSNFVGFPHFGIDFMKLSVLELPKVFKLLSLKSETPI